MGGEIKIIHVNWGKNLAKIFRNLTKFWQLNKAF